MATRKSNEVLNKFVTTRGTSDYCGALAETLNGRRSPGEERISRQVLTGQVLEVFLNAFPDVFDAFIAGADAGGETAVGDVTSRLRQTAGLAGPSGFRPTLELFLDHLVLPADTEVRVVHSRRTEGERGRREGEIVVEYGPRVRSVSPKDNGGSQSASGPS